MKIKKIEIDYSIIFELNRIYFHNYRSKYSLIVREHRWSIVVQRVFRSNEEERFHHVQSNERNVVDVFDQKENLVQQPMPMPMSLMLR